MVISKFDLQVIFEVQWGKIKVIEIEIEIEIENRFLNMIEIEIENNFFVMIEIEIENHFSNDFPIAC